MPRLYDKQVVARPPARRRGPLVYAPACRVGLVPRQEQPRVRRASARAMAVCTVDVEPCPRAILDRRITLDRRRRRRIGRQTRQNPARLPVSKLRHALRSNMIQVARRRADRHEVVAKRMAFLALGAIGHGIIDRQRLAIRRDRLDHLLVAHWRIDRLGLLGIPYIGIGDPPVRLADQKTRLHIPLVLRRLAHVRCKREGLDQNGPDRKIEYAALGVGGRFSLRHVHRAMLCCVIREQRVDEIVGHDALGRFPRRHVAEQAIVRQLGRRVLADDHRVAHASGLAAGRQGKQASGNQRREGNTHSRHSAIIDEQQAVAIRNRRLTPRLKRPPRPPSACRARAQPAWAPRSARQRDAWATDWPW